MTDVAARVPTIQQANPEGPAVTVSWSDSLQSRFPAVWLRDNCPCAACVHPGSGQRLLDTASISLDVAPSSTSVDQAGGLEIVWSGDGHTSRYDAAWLRSQRDGSQDRVGGHQVLWDARLAGALPTGELDLLTRSDRALRDWLEAADRYGFALLHGVPSQPGQIFAVVGLFGYVRETNYGRLFDVQSVLNPTNLAYTGLGLGPHTDNPYRDPTPTLQLLHCLSSDVSGGENTLVDGFQAAERLRATEPAMIDLLSRYPVRFRYADDDTDLVAEVPVITLDVDGKVTAIHFNNRSKERFLVGSAFMEAYYGAYQAFANLLTSPELQIAVRLDPGDLLLIDNTRVLHGRTAYASGGKRHLQGCYADRDGLRSRLAVLNRRLAGADTGERQV